MGWTGFSGVVNRDDVDEPRPQISTSPVFEERPPWLEHMWEEYPQTSAFLYYAGFGLMDPKMPVELRTFGPAYVAANVFGVGALMWVLDPSDVREGGIMQTEFWKRNIAPVQMPWENPRYVWN